MAIRFPPERRQPPPHYLPGPRRSEARAERVVVRAIVHPDAIRISAAPPSAPRSGRTPIPPHAIAFPPGRPPPGVTVAAPAAPRAIVRAIVHPDAALPAPARPVVERRISQPTAPHRIAFGPAIAAPR